MKAFIKDLTLVLISFAFVAMSAVILVAKQDVPLVIWFGLFLFGLSLATHLYIFIRNLKQNSYGFNTTKKTSENILDSNMDIPINTKKYTSYSSRRGRKYNKMIH